jgi:hypothetical protein
MSSTLDLMTTFAVTATKEEDGTVRHARYSAAGTQRLLVPRLAAAPPSRDQTGCWMPAVRLASPSSPTNRQVHPRVRRKARVAVTPIRTARKPAMRFGGDRIHAAAAKPMSAQSSSGSPTASIPTAGIPGGSLSPVTPRVPATSQGALLVRRGQSQQGFGRRSCCLVSTTWPPRWNLPF